MDGVQVVYRVFRCSHETIAGVMWEGVFQLVCTDALMLHILRLRRCLWMLSAEKYDDLRCHVSVSGAARAEELCS